MNHEHQHEHKHEHKHEHNHEHECEDENNYDCLSKTSNDVQHGHSHEVIKLKYQFYFQFLNDNFFLAF